MKKYSQIYSHAISMKLKVLRKCLCCKFNNFIGRVKDQSLKQEQMAKINLHLKEPNFDPAKALAYEPLKLSNLEPRVTFESKIGDHSRSIPTGSTLKIVDKHQQLSTLKATIQKLWESLETDSSGILCLKMDWRVLIVNVEITAFLKVVHAAAPDTDALVGLYTREAGRLNARLPLMQKITRREFLKYRLESLAKTRAPEQVQLLMYIKSLTFYAANRRA